MVRNSLTLALTLVALGFLCGCDDTDLTAAPSADLSSEMLEAALESDRMTEEIVGAELDAMVGAVEGLGQIVDERTFRRTRPCPLGGEFTVEGAIVRNLDLETGVMEAEITGGRTRVDCAFARADMTITVNGASEWEKFRRRVDRRPDGPQTSHYSGSWYAVRSDGAERSCTFDFTVVRDPETWTRTIEGTLCSVRIRRTVGWTG